MAQYCIKGVYSWGQPNPLHRGAEKINMQTPDNYNLSDLRSDVEILNQRVAVSRPGPPSIRKGDGSHDLFGGAADVIKYEKDHPFNLSELKSTSALSKMKVAVARPETEQSRNEDFKNFSENVEKLTDDPSKPITAESVLKKLDDIKTTLPKKEIDSFAEFKRMVLALQLISRTRVYTNEERVLLDNINDSLNLYLMQGIGAFTRKKK